MLSLDKNKFSYVIFDNVDELGIIGKIVHPDMKQLIFIRPKSVPHFENKNIVFMQLASPTVDTLNVVDQKWDDLPMHNIPEGQDEKYKSLFKALLKEMYYIDIDYKSIERLRNKDSFTECFLFHEIGHYMHSDEIYEEKSIDRQKVIESGRVLKQEIDADEFAYSVKGEEYYDVLKEEQRLMLENADLDNNFVFMLDAAELKMRIEHLAQLILRDRGRK